MHTAQYTTRYGKNPQVKQNKYTELCQQPNHGLNKQRKQNTTCVKVIKKRLYQKTTN